MTKTLAVYDEMPVMELGAVLVKSGFFSDARDVSQAVVKVLAGREIGFGPIASMTGVYIVKGKPALSANLMAAAVKRDSRYNYRVAQLTDEICELVFFEDGQESGRSVFTKADAAKAGTQNMGKFPRNMLFARALSNGVRWHCPDVMSGAPVYTPDELGALVDGETGDVIAGSYEVVLETPQPEPPPPARFDPDNPDAPCEDWPGLFSAAVEHLRYKHVEHVKNTLKQGFPDGKGKVSDGWSYLSVHQAEKAKPDDTYPTRAELLGQWTTLWDKAKVLGLAVDGIETSGMSDGDIAAAVDGLNVQVVAKESEIK